MTGWKVAAAAAAATVGALAAFALTGVADTGTLQLTSTVTKTKVTLSWTAPVDALGYVFTLDGTRVSNTWDGARTSVSFSNYPGTHVYGVIVVTDIDSAAVTLPPPATTASASTTTATTTTAATTTAAATTTTTATTTAATTTVAAASGPWLWDAETATVAADSPTLAAKVAAVANAGSYMDASVAVQQSPAGTPAYAIPGGNLDPTVPIPAGTKPGASDDHHLTVTDANGREHDLWGTVYDTATGRIDRVGGGASFPAGAVTEPRPGSATASRLPLNRGLITPADLQAGSIDHPLVFSFPVGTATSGTHALYPADTDYNGNPLYGQWFRLDPAVDCDTLGLDQLNLLICRALQRYGMFNRDVGTVLAVYGQDMVNQGGNAAAWPISLPIVNSSGYPFALKLSPALPWGSLQALNPPSP